MLRVGSKLYPKICKRYARIDALNRIRNENQQINVLGIQQLTPKLRDKVFGPQNRTTSPKNVELAQDHLFNNDLLNKKTGRAIPLDFQVPKLLGSSLDEHFYKIGRDVSEPYLSNIQNFIKQEIPSIPKVWKKQSGWTKYQGETITKVDYPDESCLVFDVEVLYKHNDYAVMATACSSTAWYAWISPWLLGETENEKQLIPLSNKGSKNVIVGHNVGYDRKRVKDEYHIQQSGNFFLDTMSLHIAVNGMCSRQRPTWRKMNKQKAEKEESFQDEVAENPWFSHSAMNGLADVAYLHCGITIDKSERELFGEYDREKVVEELGALLTYCARDVDITFKVLCKILPAFLNVCPHPVSFAGLKELSTAFLPINEQWDHYVQNTENIYQESTQKIHEQLKTLAEDAVSLKEDPKKYTKDPWLSQLDWEIKPVRMLKGKKKGDPERPDPRQKLPGMPNWYKSLFASSTKPMNLSVRSRLAPLLLRLQWDGNPLIWTDIYGWCFATTKKNQKKYEGLNYMKCDMTREDLKYAKDTRIFFKVPHKDGPDARCISPMAKGYISYFDQGILSSEFELAKEAIRLNSQNSYWTAARERIFNQMPVYTDTTKMGVTPKKGNKFGMIIPRLVPMGTITRRAVEDTWLTASNAKKNRVGSELKAMVQAPPGYKFVGADVDSEELWIASLIGDSLFGIHGGTALGWMTLEGTKSQGTDLHSKTAHILGISRNDAKVFNYGRIYGAGLKFAATLLRQFNPLTSTEEANRIASKLYEATKGVKARVKGFDVKQFWRGGSESVVFNRLEELAEQNTPRTPVLGAAITEALTKRNLGTGSNFLTSRINWSIQSSGVDYLHLLATAMNYLIRRYNIDARLCITVHDEIRYMVKDSDKYKAALALQIANLWTRAMFCQQLGIDNVPQSVAFFSLIDIDHVMRKEVDLDCVTPSHPEPIEPGEAIDIEGLLEKCSKLTGETRDFKLYECEYSNNKKPHVDNNNIEIDEAQEHVNHEYLRAQISQDSEEVKKIAKKVRKIKGIKPKKLVKKPLSPNVFIDLETIKELNSSSDFYVVDNTYDTLPIESGPLYRNAYKRSLRK